MKAAEFFQRRNDAVGATTVGNLSAAETALRSLLVDCHQTEEGSCWSPIAESDLAIVLAKSSALGAATETMRHAYREGCKSNPVVQLLVTHNRAVMCDVLSEPDESADWAWQTAEIVRAHENVLPRLGGRTEFDATIFAIGAQALHVVIDHYCYREPDFKHAGTFVPDALRWISHAIEAEGDSREGASEFLRERERLLILQQLIEARLRPGPHERAIFEATARGGVWIVAGAGLSVAPPAQIPTWQQIKADTLQQALEVLKAQNAAWGNTFTTPSRLEENAGDLLQLPEEALEDMCLTFGVEATVRRLTAVIGRSGETPAPTGAHHAIVDLAAQGKLGGVITTNFDTLLEEALRAKGVEFQVLLDGATPGPGSALPIMKVHGSIEAPTSLSFRRTAYYRGLPSGFGDFVREKVRNVEILIVGYSGNDSDLFPLLRDRLADRAEGNHGILVAPSAPGAGSAFAPLIDSGRLEQIQMTADAFFGRETPTAADVRVSNSVLPSDDIGSVVAFLALATSRTESLDAYRLFFLVQDIAETAHDLRLEAVAHFGKCLSEHSAQESADEFSMGWSCLEQAHAVRQESVSGGLAAWSISALVHVTRFALARYLAVRGVPQQIHQFYLFWHALTEEFRRDRVDEESLTAARLFQGLLAAIADGHHDWRHAAAGFLGVIEAAKATGHYEFELDAVEMLAALDPAEPHLAFEIPQHVAFIERRANAGQRRCLADIMSKEFEMRRFNVIHEGQWEVSGPNRTPDGSTAPEPPLASANDPEPAPHDQNAWDRLRMEGQWARDAGARTVIERDPVASQALADYARGHALVELRKRLMLDPRSDTKDIRLMTLGILEYYGGDLHAAGSTLRKASETTDEQVRGLASYKLGLVLEKLGDIPGAMAAYRVSTASSDKVLAGPAALNLGALFWNRGQIEEAVPPFEQAASSGHPDATPAGLYYLAFASFHRHDVARTLELLKKAAAFDHEELAPKASYELGALLSKLGRAAEAIDALLKAASSPNPEIGPTAAVDLGMEYANSGDLRAARTWWERAVRSGNPRQAGMAERNLKRLRAIELEAHRER